MDAIHSKSAFVYGQIRRALRSGRYAPGQRTDSVTFDLSQKAEREQTRRTLEWLRRMRANVRDPTDDRYEAPLTLPSVGRQAGLITKAQTWI